MKRRIRKIRRVVRCVLIITVLTTTTPPTVIAAVEVKYQDYLSEFNWPVVIATVPRNRARASLVRIKVSAAIADFRTLHFQNIFVEGFPSVQNFDLREYLFVLLTPMESKIESRWHAQLSFCQSFVYFAPKGRCPMTKNQNEEFDDRYARHRRTIEKQYSRFRRVLIDVKYVLRELSRPFYSDDESPLTQLAKVFYQFTRLYNASVALRENMPWALHPLGETEEFFKQWDAALLSAIVPFVTLMSQFSAHFPPLLVEQFQTLSVRANAGASASSLVIPSKIVFEQTCRDCLCGVICRFFGVSK